MKRFLQVLLLALAALPGLARPRTLSAQSPLPKALVYCPSLVDETGCDRIVAALTSFQVDRAYDGTPTSRGFPTVDLRTADLSGYALFFIPALANTRVNGVTRGPYRLLNENPQVQTNLTWYLSGRTIAWTGMPDDAVTPAKTRLIQNLAAHAQALPGEGSLGFVFLLDASTITTKYNWLPNIANGLAITPCDRPWQDFMPGIEPPCDPRPGFQMIGLNIYDEVAALNAVGTTLLTDVGNYPAMAMEGIARHVGDDNQGWSGNVVGQYRDAAGEPLPGSQVSISWRRNGTTSSIAPAQLVVHVGAPWAFTATFRNASGTAVANVSVFIRLNGVAYRRGTNVNGQATLSSSDPDVLAQPALAAGSTYAVEARFQGSINGNQAGTNSRAELVIAPATATAIAVSPASGTFGGTTTLSATLTADGAGLADRSVAFSLNGIPAGAATTDASGVATIANASLSGINGGTYPTGVRASFASGTGFVGSTGTAALTVAQATATVTLVPASLTHTYDGSPKSATATTDPTGLPVTFTYDGGATPPMNVGEYAVVATVNTANYAGSTTGTLTIARATPILTWAQPADIFFGTALDATQLNATANVPGTFTYTPAAGTLLPTGLDQTLSVAFAPADAANYTAASASVLIDVLRAPQTISFEPLPDRKQGDPAFTVSATASSGLPVSFAASGACSVSGSTVTLIGTGTCTVTALQAGNNDFQPAVPVSQSFAVGRAQATITLSDLAHTYDGTPKAATATTTPPGLQTVTVTYDGSASPPVDAGSYSVVATLSNPDYQADPATGTLTIAQRTQVITFEQPADRAYGTAPFTVTATASTGLPASIATGAPDICSVNGNTVTLLATGSCTLTATHAGDLNTAPAEPVSRTFTVTRGAATVTVASAFRAYGDPNPALSGTITGLASPGDLTCQYATEATATSNVGSYPITATCTEPAGRHNYDVTVIPGALEVRQVALVIAANDARRSYGAANPAFTGTISGLKNDDAITATYTTTAEPASTAAATYPITPAPVDPDGRLGNYSLDLRDGVLTVERVPLSVTASDGTRMYGGDDPVFTASFTGFVLGETQAVLGGTLSFETPPRDRDTGTAPVRPSGLTSPNYDITYHDGTLTITPAPLTVTADNARRQYGMANPAFTASFSGFVLGQNPGVLQGALVSSTAAEPSSPIGDYQVTPSGLASRNYEIEFVAGTITIEPRAATVTANDDSRAYGADDPPFTGAISGAVFPGDLSCTYTTSAGRSSAPGPYPITPSCAPNPSYHVTLVPGVLTITRAPLTVTARSASRAYGQENPAFEADFAGFVNGENVSVLGGLLSFTTSAEPRSPVGTYAITPAGVTSPNYDIEYVAGTLTVLQVRLTVTVADASRGYGAADPPFTGTLAGLVAGDAIEAQYTTAALLASPVGEYAIRATLDDPDGRLPNYDVQSTDGTLTITAVPLDVAAADVTRPYGSASHFTATYSGFVLGEDHTALGGVLTFASADEHGDAGNHAITPGGLTSDNYRIRYVDGTLTITKVLLTVRPDDKRRAYGAENPALTGTIAGFVLGETPAVLTAQPVYATEATAATRVGSYPITASGASAANYDFAYETGTLLIEQSALVATAGDAARGYGEENPVFTGTLVGLRAGDAVTATFTTTATRESDVARYPIVVELSGAPEVLANYEITRTDGTLEITQAALTVTANSVERLYGDPDPAFTARYEGFVLEQTPAELQGELTFVLGDPSPLADPKYVETRSITPRGLSSSNYHIVFRSGVLGVLPAPLTVTAASVSRGYGQENPALAGTILGLRNGDVITAEYATLATAESDVGGYAITPSLVDPNDRQRFYVVKVEPGTLTITRALLTVLPDDKQRQYGQPNPELTGTIAGFVLGQTASVLTSQPVYATAATQQSGADSYAITASGAAATNYDFSYETGTLLIGKAALVASANDASRRYGAENPALTGTLEGVVAGDEITATYTTTALRESGVTTYPITAQVIGAPEVLASYEITLRHGTLTVERAPLLVRADPAERTYGDPDPAFTVTYTGFVVDETPAALQGSLVFSLKEDVDFRPDGRFVQLFYITPSGLTSTNYAIEFAENKLAVRPAPLTVTAASVSRPYGEENPPLTGTVEGLRNGDAIGAAYATAATAASDVGDYPITPLLDDPDKRARFYTVTLVPGNLAITPAAQTIAFAELGAKVFGDAPFLVSATATSGLPASFAAAGSCTVADEPSYAAGDGTPSQGRVTITGAGECTVTASQVGGGNYLAAESVPRGFAIAKATPTLVWATLAPITYGAALGDAQLNAMPSVPGVVSYSPAAGTVLDAGDGQPLAASFTPADAENYESASASAQISVARAPLAVTAADVSRLYGEANPAFTGSVVGARAADGITAEYVTDATQVSPAGSYQILPRLLDPANRLGNYVVSSTAGTLTIERAPQSILFGTLAGKTYGDDAFALGATATSGLGVSYTTAGACTVAGSLVSITGAGRCDVTARQTGDANHLAASDVTQGFDIAKAALTVTADDQSREFGQTNPVLTGTITGIRHADNLSAEYTTVATASSAAGVYPIVPALVDPDGRVANYEVSLVDGTLTVAKANQTVTFDPPASKVYTDPAFSITGSSTSGLAVTFSSATADRCSTTSDGSVVKLLDVGVDAAACTLTASQAGGANHHPASSAKPVNIYNKLDAVTGSTTAQKSNQIQWSGSVSDFNVSILTIKNADGSVLFDAARIDAKTITVTGPSGKVARPSLDSNGNPKTTLIDTNGDMTRDRVVYFKETDVFDAGHVGGTWTITLNGNLLTVAGDLKRDGRPIRGTDKIKIVP